MISIIFLLSTTALLSQGLPSKSVFDAWNGDARIVGGTEAKDNEFPFIVSIKWQKIGHACAGSIINKRKVVTAAHCLQDRKAADLKVVVGSNSIIKGGTSHNVASCLQHKDFKMKTAVHDIGMITVSTDIAFTDRVKPISPSTVVTGGGVSLIAAGWGYIKFPSSEGFPANLRKVTLTSVTVPECQKAQSDFGEIGKAVNGRQVCAGGTKDVGTCHGDSGGPLIGSGKLVGIVSWGRPCAKGYPDVFTRVSSYVDWITANSKL